MRKNGADDERVGERKMMILGIEKEAEIIDKR